jgi:hypothetical protein
MQLTFRGYGSGFVQNATITGLQSAVVTGKADRPLAAFVRIADGGIWTNNNQEPDFYATLLTLGLQTRVPVCQVLGEAGLGVRYKVGSVLEPPVYLQGLQLVLLRDNFAQPLTLFERTERGGVRVWSLSDAEFAKKIEQAGLMASNQVVTGGRLELDEAGWKASK